jgi:hypothetical protein
MGLASVAPVLGLNRWTHSVSLLGTASLGHQCQRHDVGLALKDPTLGQLKGPIKCLQQKKFHVLKKPGIRKFIIHVHAVIRILAFQHSTRPDSPHGEEFVMAKWCISPAPIFPMRTHLAVVVGNVCST